MFFFDVLKKESPLPLRWCRVLTIIIFSCALCTSFMILIAKLVDEVPAIKVTYEPKKSIPAPNIFYRGVINGCEIFRDNLSYDSDGMCPKYLKSNLSFAEDVRKNVERISQTDLSDYMGLIHNGTISLKEGDVIRLYLTINSTILNSIILFDSEYLKYSDQPLYIDSLSLQNIYFLSHNINSSLYNFNRFKRQLMDKTLFTQLGFSPTYKTYYYVTTEPVFVGFSQGASVNNVTNMLLVIKPKTTILQVEKEQKSRTILDILGTITALYGLMLSFYIFLFQKELSSQPYGLIKRFVACGGPPERSLVERFKDPLEKSLVERIEYIESQIGLKHENYKHRYFYY